MALRAISRIWSCISATTIYEKSWGHAPCAPGNGRSEFQRTACLSFRNRYAALQIRRRPSRACATAAFPWLSIWDGTTRCRTDYANDRFVHDVTIRSSLFERSARAAYQAYYEHLAVCRNRAAPRWDRTRPSNAHYRFWRHAGTCCCSTTRANIVPRRPCVQGGVARRRLPDLPRADRRSTRAACSGRGAGAVVLTHGLADSKGRLDRRGRRQTLMGRSQAAGMPRAGDRYWDGRPGTDIRMARPPACLDSVVGAQKSAIPVVIGRRPATRLLCCRPQTRFFATRTRRPSATEFVGNLDHLGMVPGENSIRQARSPANPGLIYCERRQARLRPVVETWAADPLRSVFRGGSTTSRECPQRSTPARNPSWSRIGAPPARKGGLIADNRPKKDLMALNARRRAGRGRGVAATLVEMQRRATRDHAQGAARTSSPMPYLCGGEDRELTGLKAN